MSIPFVLGLDEWVEGECQKTSTKKEICSAVHSLVSVYLIFVAKTLNNVQLEEFVNEISENEHSPEFEYPSFTTKAKKWSL